MAPFAPFHVLLLMSSFAVTSGEVARVSVRGSMRAIHKEGRASAVATLDTLQRPGVFAIGPVANLQGEFVVWDGSVHVSRRSADTVVNSTSPLVDAALLVQTEATVWTPILTTSRGMNLVELAEELRSKGLTRPRSFLRFETRADTIDWHVIHWPHGEPIKAGDHQRYALRGKDVETTVRITGVVDEDGAGVVTHHNSPLHLHGVFLDGRAVHIDGLVIPAGTVILRADS